MKAQENLDEQQKHLTDVNYDLRISNLARFIATKLPGSGILLDVGAGSGLMMKLFKQRGYDVAGIEYDPELVKRMHADPQLKKLDIKQGDITKLRGKEQYDIVVSNDVIEHIEDDRKALQNLWSYVKPGGMLVITVPAHSFLYSQRDRDWGHFRRYNKSELHEKMEALGGKMAFITFWNSLGFWVYLTMERLLHLKTHEKIRYGKSKSTSVIKSVVEKILQIEEKTGGTLLGLSLVAGMKKPL
ncbi:MAG: methyltransferase domain-containing protein [Weeksellaceae bacterium]